MASSPISALSSEPQSRLLSPLDEFYTRAGVPLPIVEPVNGEEVPQPYRDLLVHNRDMTPTLEAFHGERIHLRPIERRVVGDSLARQVVLTGDDSGRPVEYGAIIIHTAQFPEPARELILGNRCPLGTILALHEIVHESRPQGFFRLLSDTRIGEALGLAEPQALYGRRNILQTPDGQVLAEVVEILPPAAG